MSTHAPLFFGKTCVPKNNLYHIGSKDDINTPSAMHVLRAIVVYRPCLQTDYLMSQTSSNICYLDNTSVFMNAFHGLTCLIFSTWILQLRKTYLFQPVIRLALDLSLPAEAARFKSASSILERLGIGFLKNMNHATINMITRCLLPQFICSPNVRPRYMINAKITQSRNYILASIKINIKRFVKSYEIHRYLMHN